MAAIIGWSPPDNADFLPLDSPASSVSSDDSPPPDPCSASGKHDPGWIARPRNEFILFRCEYVRKHSRDGCKRTRRPPGSDAEKTLSKQAAEAWHHLPPEERLYWKERANGERKEHARRYPDYRYRPKKSAPGRRRQAHCSPAIPEAEPATMKSAPPSPPKSPASMPAIHHPSGPPPRPAGPARHASVPHYHINDTAHRRLRSTASAGWIGVAPVRTDVLPFAAPTTPRQFARMHLHDQPMFHPSDYIAPHPVPSPALLSCSLLNWDGARIAPPPLQQTQYLSPTSVSLSPLPLPTLDMGSTTAQILAEYTTGGNPEPSAESQAQAQSHSQNQNQPQSQSHTQPQDHMYSTILNCTPGMVDEIWASPTSVGTWDLW